MSTSFFTIVKRPVDLQTPHDEIVKGFIEQANRKTHLADPYIKEGERLRAELERCTTVDDILGNSELKNAILYSAGLSAKAQGHLTAEECTIVAQAAVRQFHAETADIKLQILYRYLLTRGDSLGGSIRNWIGSTAGNKVIEGVRTALKVGGISATVRRTRTGAIEAVQWSGRLLVFNKKPKFVTKNLDVILLSFATGDSMPAVLELRQKYLAVGELKGGIDPAGADEHWKTARSALERVREVFPAGDGLKLFFAGASIEAAMAAEIYKYVTDGKLHFAANLTSPTQTDALIRWLISL